MTAALPTLVLSRRPRSVGPGWDDVRSWFGGAPQLGKQSWPRTRVRRAPKSFVAQIDLAEVAREVARFGGPTVPAGGALAFFVGGDDWGPDSGAVVHVPRPELGVPTPPPPDAPAVYEARGYIFPATSDQASPRLFPRWPLTITALDLASDVDAAGPAARWAAEVAAVERHFSRPQYSFSSRAAYARLGDAPRPYWWHTAHHYVAGLQATVRGAPAVVGQRKGLDAARAELARRRPTGVAGVLAGLGFRTSAVSPEERKAEEAVAWHEARLAELARLTPDFERFVREVADWVRGTDPWQPMPPEAVARLAATFERGRTTFGDLTRYRTPDSLEEVETETLLALATADDRAYALLPEAVRSLIDTQHLLPPGSWHQMFGRGVDIQGAASENEGNVLLLQLVYDAMMHWEFGDMGAFQFWIPPDDLAAGNWAAVRLTFEAN